MSRIKEEIKWNKRIKEKIISARKLSDPIFLPPPPQGWREKPPFFSMRRFVKGFPLWLTLVFPLLQLNALYVSAILYISYSCFSFFLSIFAFIVVITQKRGRFITWCLVFFSSLDCICWLHRSHRVSWRCDSLTHQFAIKIKKKKERSTWIWIYRQQLGTKIIAHIFFSYTSC